MYNRQYGLAIRISGISIFRKFLILLIGGAAISLVASCSLTPVQLMESGEVFYFQTSSSPKEAAWCMGRAAEERNTMWRPTVRPLSTDGAVELLVQVLSGGDSATILVAHFRPKKNGSKIKVWLRRLPLYGGRSNFLNALVSGCSMDVVNDADMVKR